MWKRGSRKLENPTWQAARVQIISSHTRGMYSCEPVHANLRHCPEANPPDLQTKPPVRCPCGLSGAKERCYRFTGIQSYARRACTVSPKNEDDKDSICFNSRMVTMNGPVPARPDRSGVRSQGRVAAINFHHACHLSALPMSMSTALVGLRPLRGQGGSPAIDFLRLGSTVL